MAPPLGADPRELQTQLSVLVSGMLEWPTNAVHKAGENAPLG